MGRLTESNKLKKQRKMKKTMKQYSFASRLKSLALVFGIALAFASCANEDIAQNPNGTDNNKNFTIFSTGDPATRTSMESNGAFYWEAGDKIWVKDDNGTWQQSRNAPTEKTASFKFEVPGSFTKTSTYKVYYPGKNGNQNHVTIAANQSQAEPNTTAHFGTSGDCGMADAAWSNTKNGFAFTLDHKAAYLLFLPRTSNTILHDCYLTKVEVNSDDDITSTYTLDPVTGELTGTGTGKQITISTGGSGAYANGFPLTNNATNAATNGAYVVIKPGTHTLKIRYWVKDIATNVEGTITKYLTSKTFDQNKYYNITADLQVNNYEEHYYMWNAQNNYWAGHEWNSATPWQPSLASQPANPNYPQDGDALGRYYDKTDLGWHVRYDATTSLFKTLPNANEISWYVNNDPRWDADELWTTMGHLYKGGVWLKKKSVLMAEGTYDKEHSYYHSFDARGQAYILANYHVSVTPPSASEIGNYFYLPALGYYESGQLKGIGERGLYWSSSNSGWNSYTAYCLTFGSGSAFAASPDYPRYFGGIVKAFE